MPYHLDYPEQPHKDKKNITFALDTSWGEVIQSKVTNLFKLGIA